MWFDLETKDIKEHIKMAFDGTAFRDQKKKKEKNKYPCQLNQITGNRDLEPIFLGEIIIDKNQFSTRNWCIYCSAHFYTLQELQEFQTVFEVT